MERSEKVSKKVTEIPKKIKSVSTKVRAELLPLRVNWKIKSGHVNTQNL